MTGKQRAQLRAMANGIQPICQIGKNGIVDTLVAQLDDALEARELIKVTVLENVELTAREAAGILAEKLDAEPIQAIGRKLVLYRRSMENPRIELELL